MEPADVALIEMESTNDPVGRVDRGMKEGNMHAHRYDIFPYKSYGRFFVIEIYRFETTKEVISKN